MNIGILTQPLVVNYGGILQCFALQHYLESRGHNVIILNRKTKPGVLYRIKQPIRHIKHIFDGSFKGRLSINRFIRTSINLSGPIYSSLGLYEAMKDYNLDGIIVGSDQVWRECYSPNIEDFFLGFIPDNYHCFKIAFSASFGTSDNPISQRCLKTCVEYAKKFSAVSVREDSGRIILRDIFNITAKVTLDPTLILPKYCYDQLYKHKEKRFNQFVLSYILDDTCEKNQIIEDVTKYYSLPCYNIRYKSKNNPISIIIPPIEEWLDLFNSADFIVTDSFHGCVFSIINKKQFILISNEGRGLERFLSLLGMLGLLDRLIYSCNDYYQKRSILPKPIDYATVDRIIEQKQKESLEFLNTALHSVEVQES